MKDWRRVDDEIDMQTKALYRSDRGDEIEIRDSYRPPVQLMDVRIDRYQVIYDPAGGVPFNAPEAPFPRYRDAEEYVEDVLIGEDGDTK